MAAPAMMPVSHEAQHDLEQEGLQRRAGRQGRAQGRMRREEHQHQEAGGDRAHHLGSDVGQHGLPGQALREEEAQRDGGIDVRTGDLPEGVDHRHHDHAER